MAASSSDLAPSLFQYYYPIRQVDNTLMKDDNGFLVFVHKIEGTLIAVDPQDLDEAEIMRFNSNEAAASILPTSGSITVNVDGGCISNPDEASGSKANGDIWMNVKSLAAKEVDKCATIKLLDTIRSDLIQLKLKDRRLKKKDVWNLVGEKMTAEGFNVSGDKCHQKYRNLEKSYKDWILHKKTTGKGSRKVPDFINELEALFGGRHAIHPVSILDTSHDSDPESSIAINSTSASSSPASSSKKSSSRSTNIMAFLEVLRREQTEQAEKSDKKYEDMCKLMSKHHKDRMSMMDKLTRAITKQDRNQRQPIESGSSESEA